MEGAGNVMNNGQSQEKDLMYSTPWNRFIAEKAELTLWEYDIPSRRLRVHYSKPQYGIAKIIENVPESLAVYVEERSMPDLINMYKRIDNGEKEVSCEIWYKSDLAQGPHCERVIYTVVKEENGKPLLAYGMAQNITAQKLGEEQFNRTMGHVLENSSEFIAVFNLNLTHNAIIGGNSNRVKALELLKSRSYDEFLRNFEKMFANKEELAIFRRDCSRIAVLEAFRKGKTSHSFTFQCVTGEYGIRWLKSSYLVRQNSLTGDIEVTTYTQDVHDQVLMDKVMKNLSKSILENISVIDLDRQKYLYLSLNDSAHDIVVNMTDNYDNEINYVAEHLVVPEEKASYLANILQNNVVKRLDKEGSFNYDVSLVDNKGKFCRKMLNYSYLDENHSMILVLVQDVTTSFLHQKDQIERVQVAMHRERRAIDSKREFLSNISHDMRTPLNGIIGFTGLAMASHSEKEIQEYLQKIKVSGGLLLDLINDTLMLSKLESGKLRPKYEIIDNRTISTRVIVPLKEAAEKKNITFIADRSKSPQVLLKADRVNTQKIFLNLLSNAIKFTPEGGEVAIIMEQLQEPIYNCNFRFIVRDNGIGMSPEFLEKMYEPFAQENVIETENQYGTGLGLSIAWQLVQLLKGHIEVKSEVGKGTEFTVFLPLPLATPEEAAVAADKAALHTSDDVWIPNNDISKEVRDVYESIASVGARHVEAPAGASKILLCEDNDLNTEIAATLLQQKGYEVACAINGKQGSQIFAESEPGEFAAILMDLRMPVMNGYEASRTIRNMNRPDAKKIPIIAMSADAFAEDRQQSQDAGMNAHLAKPVDPDLMFRTLEKFIDSTRKT